MSRRVGIDFTGVESFKKASEGEHGCRIASAELKQSSGGNDMIVVAYEVIRGEDKGARVYENYPLTDTALWKLKGLLEAIGMKADGKVSLDLDRLIGKSVNIVVKHEEYDGKIRARVDEVKKAAVNTAASDDEEEEVEEEAPKKTKKSSKKEKEEVMHPPVNDDDEEDEWDEEDEEEEAPAPKKKSAKAEKTKATEKKAAKKPAKSEEEDEDDDWDDDDWDE